MFNCSYLILALLEERLEVARALLAGGHGSLPLGRPPLRLGHFVDFLAPLANEPPQERSDLILVAELLETHIPLLGLAFLVLDLRAGFGLRHRRCLSAQRLYVAEEVVGLPLPDLRRVNVGQRGGVLEHLLEAGRVILAEECGRLPQQAQAPDDLLPRERPRRVVRTVFRPRCVGSSGVGGRGSRGGSGRRGGRRGARREPSELLLEEELALGLADALDLAGLDLSAADDFAAAEVGVQELALPLQLALQHVHTGGDRLSRRRRAFGSSASRRGSEDERKSGEVSIVAGSRRFGYVFDRKCGTIDFGLWPSQTTRDRDPA
jgi:hypothetical protein